MINRQAVKLDNRIFLSLGSNIGDRRAYLAEAIDHIREIGLDVARKSSIYETEPVGYKDQDWFLNQVIEVCISAERKLKISSTDQDNFNRLGDPANSRGAQAILAAAILRALLKIEAEMGRQRSFKNAPRVIDIDLLLFGNLCLDLRREAGAGLDLILPHPRLTERRFVLEPLCEIADDLIDPVSKKSFREILFLLRDRSTVRRLES
jgi:2-amino-4-hydroxy-6-hydroxymethyldihydropteridine diphosphokinase